MWPFAPDEVRTVMATLDAIECTVREVPDDQSVLNDHIYNLLGLIEMMRSAATEEWKISENVDALTMLVSEINTLVQQTDIVARRASNAAHGGGVGRPIYLMLAELQFLSSRASDLMLAVARVGDGIAHD